VARENGVSLLECARILVAEEGLSPKARAALRQLITQFDRWHAAIAGSPEFPAGPSEQTIVFDDDVGGDPLSHRQAGAGMSHVDLAEAILEESGYTAMWQAEKSPDAAGRLENLKELVKALDEFENLQGFLEHVSLVMDNEQDADAAKVSIMTLHAAKGLEFPCVFLPGWEDGLFPSQRSMDESGLKGLEEERRLAYVGITRAERLCTISFAANRRVYNQWQSSMPSRFIDELPAEHVEVLTPPGLYGGGFGAAAPVSTLADTAAKSDVYNSPGWRRMTTRAAERPVSQPREARNMVIDAEAVPAHDLGTRVFHQKFGYGVVSAVEGDKLTIAFEKAGVKNVVARFVTAAEDVPF
jgi:DNA helicase-2/ATP-dependent DNA helicase PcrA